MWLLSSTGINFICSSGGEAQALKSLATVPRIGLVSGHVVGVAALLLVDETDSIRARFADILDVLRRS
jgi:hypothetical protein